MNFSTLREKPCTSNTRLRACPTKTVFIHQMELFTIRKNRWYGWQMLPGYISGVFRPYFSPVYIYDFHPLKTGGSLIEIGFFNAFYAQGVRDFTQTLKVVERSSSFLFAKISREHAALDERFAIISELEMKWLESLCPTLFENPAARRPPGVTHSEDPQELLGRLYSVR